VRKETTVMEVAVKNDWKRRWRILGKRFCGEEVVKYDGKMLLLFCVTYDFFCLETKGILFLQGAKISFSRSLEQKHCDSY
jgi:hypothetical protein